MIKLACLCPHPPLLLPGMGSNEDKQQVKKTIKALNVLAEQMKKAAPDEIIISSPHPDWGFNVPLHFLAPTTPAEQIKQYLTGPEPPEFHFQQGKRFYALKVENCKLKIALIASGDLSHCLKDDGPYGFHPQGPKFDKALIEYLKKKDIESILKLDAMFPEAGECGLRPLCFVLGILEASGLNWQCEVLSYEAPFGVGYLTARLKLN